MTDEEKLNRALAVENMFRLYKKYYPIWVEKKKQEAVKNSNTQGVLRNTLYFACLHDRINPSCSKERDKW